MGKLELKIPPLILAVLFAFLAWLLSFVLKVKLLPQELNLILSVTVFLMGLVVALMGVFSFKQFDTTVNPTTPHDTSSLVTTGVYKFTRNPMYLGFLFWLVSWSLFLSSLLSLITPILFVLYMNKFQIKPEEKALSSIFGTEFDLYKKRVRRWL